MNFIYNIIPKIISVKFHKNRVTENMLSFYIYTNGAILKSLSVYLSIELFLFGIHRCIIPIL